MVASQPDLPARAMAPGARRITRAAARLFAKRGFAATSMADVARAAGVSKATVFHHFRTKRGLYDALVNEAVRGFQEQLVPLLDAGADPQANLQRFAEAHFERLSRMRGTMRLVLREMLDDSHAAGARAGSEDAMIEAFVRVADSIRRGQESGSVRSDADPGLATFVLLGTSWFLFQTLEIARRNPELAVTASAQDYSRELASLLYLGLKPRDEPQMKARR